MEIETFTQHVCSVGFGSGAPCLPVGGHVRINAGTVSLKERKNFAEPAKWPICIAGALI